MKRYKNDLCCSIYQPGDNVLLKYPCSKRVPKKRKIVVAKIQKRNKAFTKYLVSYTDTEGTKKCTWESVENITSLTVEREKSPKTKG